MVPISMWAKIAYENLILQACRDFLIGWHRLYWEAVPCVAQMYEPNSGANIFHIWCSSWVGIFSLMTRWQLYTTWPDGFGKEWVHMLLAPWKREFLLKWLHVAPLNFLQKPQIFVSSSFFYPHSILWKSC